MNSDQIPPEVRQRLGDIFQDFDGDLQALASQGVLTQGDVQRLRNQAEVSRDAMLKTVSTKEFDEHAKSKLLSAFVQDFELSIGRIVEGAVARKGDRALLSYKLSRIDKKLLFEARRTGNPLRSEESLLAAMAMTKSYIWRSLGTGGGRNPKPNVQRIADDYRAALVELAQRHTLPPLPAMPRQP